MANEWIKIFEQQKPTIKEFKKFSSVLISKTNLFWKPIDFWIFVNLNLHWLCGVHQKSALTFWLFMLQQYYERKIIDRVGVKIRSVS